ncbi:hypothetical protein H7691_06550 [Stenotrophomonas sp. CW117]|uniref:hypothetical protein n=1 Tax=Stenotrophomonas TaxID=40323 RepID=UPI00177C7EFC|nr:hypothetical protein [Stenotrophomonas sp. CW117]QOF99769.1 hypothetical protein H7691_06550 [Stenotrophomonas sp. CW117]
MHLQPVAQRALLAAFASQGHTLRRTRGGFVSTPAQVTTSTAVTVEAFTRRAVNWLDNANLVTFDDPTFPRAVTLTARGISMAQQLIAARTKAVAA